MNALLVDGSGLAYRAYYAFARNPLRTAHGEETSVVYAFSTTLWRWLERYHPERVAIAFDPAGPTHRHALYDAYKAQRPPRPPGLSAQMPRLRAVLAAMRLPVLVVDGWEADDVLATLAVRLGAAGDRVWLASADKDFRQLISDRVHLLRPSLRTGVDDEMGPAELLQATGLTPAQVIDWLALAGDTSDNIPGIRGIGDKTAAALVRAHGNLEGVYAELAHVRQPALRARLQEQRPSAELSRQLVQLRTDAPIPDDGDWCWPGPDAAALRPLLVELELQQLLRRLPAVAVAAPEPEVAAVVECIADAASLGARAARAAASGRPLALAVELDASTRSGALHGIAWASDPEHAVAALCVAAAPLARPGELALEFGQAAGLDAATCATALAPLVAAAGTRRIGYDLKTTAFTLARHGVHLGGDLFDVQIASYVLDPGRRPPPLAALAEEAFSARAAAGADRATQLGLQATWLLRLAAVLEARLTDQDATALFHDLEMPLVPVLAAMESAGVRIDVGRMATIAAALDTRIAAAAEAVFAAAGRRFNLQSAQQTGRVLFADLGLPHGRRTQSGYSTDSAVLEKLAPEHAVVRHLLLHRQLVKLRSNYVEALPRLVDPATGRIHTRFNQAVVATGRLSSSDPNLQNIPVRSPLGREIRSAFVSRFPGGVLLSADYSQIELRLLAHLACDPALQASFAAAGDVHTSTAARIFACAPGAVTAEQRAVAKTVNFGVVYGMGARGLAERLGIGRDEARRFIDEYFAGFPRVRAYTEELIARARRDGVATTLLGRRIRVAELDSAQPALRAAAERIAVNAPIQGSAADLIKTAMIRVHARLGDAGLRSLLVLQVHDELVFDVAPGEQDAVAALARREMEAAMALSVPLQVDIGIGPSWAEAHR